MVYKALSSECIATTTGQYRGSGKILKLMLSVKIAFENIFIKMVLLFVLDNYVMFVLYSYSCIYITIKYSIS